MYGRSIEPRLAAVSQRTLVISGGDEPALPLATEAKRVAGKMPRAMLKVRRI